MEGSAASDSNRTLPPSEANMSRATIKSALLRINSEEIRFIFKLDSGEFDVAEGRAPEDQDGNLVEFKRGDRVRIAYDSSTVPHRVNSIRKIVAATLTTGPNTYSAIVKGPIRHFDNPRAQYCIKLDFAGYDVAGGKALEDRNHNLVTFEVGDRVTVTYHPTTVPRVIVNMRKLVEN